MMEMREFQVRARVETDVLQAWVETGWLIPEKTEGRWTFREIDLGRAQLIQDLERDFGVNGEGIVLILDLVDRMSGLRRTLGHLAVAIRREPDPIRDRIADGALEVARKGGHAPDPPMGRYG
ncbi:chaperone modulator CbpM [Methylobacterium sp. J-078]|uniref:chaperone modulator CbpM n=1 Tax=Methylobacterium sp. J-078 TaxID=2836657 RepID=UPI001FBC08BF|nr:chaperone modulator CbpM [Methylobacterium sp. J-078]MCJ2045288.1 chaperone modulator CbpM [Methylobacterium sp. J-078]